jgi:hypothetical protein
MAIFLFLPNPIYLKLVLSTFFGCCVGDQMTRRPGKKKEGKWGDIYIAVLNRLYPFNTGGLGYGA